jgi:hypothetical protein
LTNILSELYDDSIATGEHGKTLTPLASLPRKRSRTRTEPFEPIQKKQKDQGGGAIVEAIKESIEARKLGITKAVELLTKEYSDRLSDSDYNDVVAVLSNEVNASVFLALPPGSKRDMWIQRQCTVFFINNDN